MSPLARGRVVRPAGFLALGAIGTAAAFVTVQTLPAGRWLYHALYSILGPNGAVRVATTGAYTLGLVGAVATALLLSQYVADRPTRTRTFDGVVVAQLMLVVAAPIAVLVHPLFVVAVVGPLGLCLLAALVVVRYRAVDSSDTMAVVTGGTVVVVILVFFAVFVPLGWNPHSVVATEVSDTDGVEPIRSDAVTAAFDAPATRCDPSPRTCHLPQSRSVIRSLDRHGVRCPYETGVSSSVVVADDGAYYRVTCTTRED